MKTVIMLTILTLTACSHTRSWDIQEKKFAGAMIIQQTINYRHLKYTKNHPKEWKEKNPVAREVLRHGDTGLIAWKVGTTAGTLWLADRFPFLRKFILFSANFILWDFVNGDLKVGVGKEW